ncbi:MAG TPA: hypothetical protein VM470_06030 [Acidimicrobiia bacterium]|nr:hypothetical protein [Acidimicrobiia bacterium]
MNDHLHDPDLIANYAEGISEAANEARRLLDECAQCRAEYETQLQMKELLSSLPQVQMTEDERQRLHRALDKVPPGKVITLAERRRAQRWIKLGTVAASLFVAVGVGSIFLQLNQGSDGGDNGALEALSATTTAPLAATTAAAAAENDTAQAPSGLAGSALRTYDGGDSEVVRAEIEQLISDSATDESIGEYSTFATEPRCTEQVEDSTVLAGADSNLDGRPIVIYIIEDEDGPRGRVFDQATCSEIDLG